MIPKTEIIPTNIYEKYRKKQPITILKHYNKLKEINKGYTYGYMFDASSVYSSMIEGNPIDIDTYLKYKETGMNTGTKLFREIQNLRNAYEFAKNRKLTFLNFLEAHKILSKNLLKPEMQGKIRTHDEVILNEEGKIIYTAAQKEIVINEFNKLISDINLLMNRKLTIIEIFYYGFMVSVVFVKIHPFTDGNGRLSRLLEKWFIAQKTDKRAWFIKSELNYYNKRKSYFLALNRAGLFYEDTDYRKLLNISLYTIKTLQKQN